MNFESHVSYINETKLWDEIQPKFKVVKLPKFKVVNDEVNNNRIFKLRNSQIKL